MSRVGVLALIFVPLLAATSHGETLYRSPPSDNSEQQTVRPVGDPEVLPIGIDFFFLEPEGGYEEAWPWPPASLER